MKYASTDFFLILPSLEYFASDLNNLCNCHSFVKEPTNRWNLVDTLTDKRSYKSLLFVFVFILKLPLLRVSVSVYCHTLHFPLSSLRQLQFPYPCMYVSSSINLVLSFLSFNLLRSCLPAAESLSRNNEEQSQSNFCSFEDKTCRCLLWVCLSRWSQGSPTSQASHCANPPDPLCGQLYRKTVTPCFITFFLSFWFVTPHFSTQI